MAQRQKVKIGDLLVNANLLTNEQLQIVLQQQKDHGGKFGQVVEQLGFATETVLMHSLAKQLHIPVINLSHYNLDPQISGKLPEKIARKFRVLVLSYQKDKYLIGMVDPCDLLAIDEVAKELQSEVDIAIVKEEDLLQVIDHIYRRSADISSFAVKLKEEIASDKLVSLGKMAVVEDDSSTVSQLLDSILHDAMQMNASDIHIEPEQELLRIRLRIDGVLEEKLIKEQQIANALVLRIKLLAKLNISEKRMPQDGRFHIVIDDKYVDIRVATMPVRYGETVVLRLLDQTKGLLEISQLGMSKNILAKLQRYVRDPFGMILVTGPTGSGKTTSLYAMLNQLNAKEKKIITIEDPIEYSLPRITQVQVKPAIDLTFAKVLRTALRQDPQIIMLGEMRDEETVKIGLRAAITGHLVFSTLHTNDAISAVVRLIDMGAASYLVGAAVKAIFTQRLLRKVCKSCEQAVEPTSEQAKLLQLLTKHKNSKFKKGSGCVHCNYSGYHGRIGVFELLEIDWQLAKILRDADTNKFINAALRQQHFKPLAIEALEYAKQGVTSLDEVLQVVGEVDNQHILQLWQGTSNK